MLGGDTLKVQAKVSHLARFIVGTTGWVSTNHAELKSDSGQLTGEAVPRACTYVVRECFEASILVEEVVCDQR